MVSLRVSVFTAALMACSMLEFALAVPLGDKLTSLSPGARNILKRTTPAAPRFVIYSDAWTYPLPSASQLQVNGMFSTMICY